MDLIESARRKSLNENRSGGALMSRPNLDIGFMPAIKSAFLAMTPAGHGQTLRFRQRCPKENPRVSSRPPEEPRPKSVGDPGQEDCRPVEHR